MKRFLSIFLVLALLCSCAVTSFAASINFTVSTNKQSADVGDTITVTVKVSNNSKLGAFDIALNYDADYFQYVGGSAEIGSPMIIINGKLVSVPVLDDSCRDKIKFSWAYADVLNSGGTVFTAKFKVLKVNGKFSITIYDAIDDDNKDVTSSIKTSGVTLKCAHGKADWKVSEKATCTKKGLEKGTCPCGYTGTREIPMLEHTIGKYTVTKEPACTEKGVKQAVCTICNKEFTEEIKATGHAYGKWVVEKEATETEKGLKKAECSVCGDVKEQAIPVISKETESTTFKENVTDEPTTEEDTTKAPEKQEPVENKKELSLVTIVITTIVVTLGIEAIIGAVIFFALKNKKNKK